MSSTRSVRPTDLVALVSFDGRVYPNEARTWERLGSDRGAPHLLTSAAQQWFSFATGRHTWISVEGQTIRGLVSARRRGARVAWEVDCLIVASEDGEHVCLRLFDQLTAGAAHAGVQKLFLRLESGSDLLPSARKAGFVPYATEHVLRLDGDRPDAQLVGTPLPAGIILRPREKPDEFALFQLYTHATPPDAQLHEASNLTEWKAATERRVGGRRSADVVAEHEGKVVAWLRTSRGTPGRLDLIIDPVIWPAADALIAWGMRELGAGRPIVAALPSYARPVVERLESAGFVQEEENALLAKRLTQLIRAPRPVRAAVKPVATV